jgi:hypothetical protein
VLPVFVNIASQEEYMDSCMRSMAAKGKVPCRSNLLVAHSVNMSACIGFSSSTSE